MQRVAGALGIQSLGTFQIAKTNVTSWMKMKFLSEHGPNMFQLFDTTDRKH
jgi:hypothetical protein